MGEKLNSQLKSANPLRLEASEESRSTSEYSGLRETALVLALLPKTTLSPSTSSPDCGLRGDSDCKMQGTQKTTFWLSHGRGRGAESTKWKQG